MKPIGMLMHEHRLIEKDIDIMGKYKVQIKDNVKPETELIDGFVDFIRMYADRTHHGKEEDILFRDLQAKDMLQEHNRIMDELIKEHVRGREMECSSEEEQEKMLQEFKDFDSKFIYEKYIKVREPLEEAAGSQDIE